MTRATSTLPALSLLTLTLVLVACSAPANSQTDPPQRAPASAPAKPEGTLKAEPPPKGLEVATFAGGCFWCMETPFEKIDGVKHVLSGYTGGKEIAPTYRQVSSGSTSHTEAVQILFDPALVSYDKLLDVFWRSMDPTDAGGQFVDRGAQYRPGIFAHGKAQRASAEASKAALIKSGRFDKPVIVPVEDAGDFWIAEDYHQDFFKKNPPRYNSYRRGSGRDAFIERAWGASPH